MLLFQIRDKGLDIEELELDLIDFGVTDLSKSESEISITAKFENFGSLQKEIERRKFDIISSEFEREAITLKYLCEDEIIKVEKLINMIDNDFNELEKMVSDVIVRNKI